MKSVVIVGAGVIGLFCAVRLARAGARVTVLEAEAEHVGVFGPGASIAAAGMLSPLVEGAPEHARIALQSYDLWKSQRSGADWADGVRFDGGVVVAKDASAAAALLAHCAAQGRRASALSGGQFAKRTGLKAKLDDAVFIEDEGLADPERVLSGLAMQARAHGVIIEHNVDAANVAASAVLTHEDRVYEADAVVIAPGAWATEALIRAAPGLGRIRAGKGHLVPVTLERPLAPNLHTPGFYLATRRNEIVLGATMEWDKFDRRVDPEQTGPLIAAAEKLLPGEIAALGRGWAGVRPMSPDDWPLIGPSGAAFIAAGHSRNGWLLAPLTAEIITAYVMGAPVEPEWAALSPQRFE
jgi:glycine oxidase